MIGQQIEKKGGRKVCTLGTGPSAIRLYECPNSWVTSESRQMLSAVYRYHEHHTLPAAGGWDDQPVWFREAWEIFRSELMAYQDKKRKEKEGKGPTWVATT